MAKKQNSTQTLDMFSYEFYNVEEDYDFEDANQTEQDRDMFDRASALLAYYPLVNAGVTARRSPFHLLDQRSLSLSALNFSIRSVGLGDISDGGVQRETMVEALVESILEQIKAHPDISEYPSDDQTQQYAADLIQHLMEPVCASIFHPQSKEFKPVSLQVLKEVDDPYGNFYIRPSVESTNLFLGSLKMSLTDDQFMLQALLEHQIAQGLIKNAFQTARKLQRRTLFYREEILDKKRRMSLNVRSVNWGEHVESKINEIKESLPILLETNRKILSSVQGNFELRRSERGHMVAALIREIRDCIDIHKGLQNELQSLDSHYQKEQSRQAFYSRWGQTLPNMVDDVLYPLMGIKPKYMGEVSESLLSIFSPPGATHVYDLKNVVMSALREKRVFEDHSTDDEDLDLEVAAQAEKPNFSKEDSDKAVDFITATVQEGPLPLSEIMEKGINSKLKNPVLHAMALMVVIYWPENHYHDLWTITKKENSFTNHICSSDDFLITAVKGSLNGPK